MMNLNMKNGRITIDGREFRGNNVSIVNNKVTVDGVVQDGELIGDVNITVEGNIEKLENTSGKVIAKDVGSITTVSGDVDCGTVADFVKTVSGDVYCGNVGGSVKTMSGDVRHR